MQNNYYKDTFSITNNTNNRWKILPSKTNLEAMCKHQQEQNLDETIA